MSRQNSYKLLTIVGPTAIGKTALSLSLASHFNTEIISGDSRQFYKEMTIGTAVPSAEELNTAKHHFIQNRSIRDNYNVGDFESDAIQLIDERFKHHNPLILVGGSGLYIDALLYGLDNFPTIDPAIRVQLKQRLSLEGITTLQNELKQVDPNSYDDIAIDNPQRLIRALEVCIGSGQPYSSFLAKKTTQRNFSPIKIGLQADRSLIYDRINKRVDQMIDSGLVEEARTLYPMRALNALQTVGYRELFRFFDGEITLDFAIEEIKKNTRRFAKRQLTWYRKDAEIEWFDYDVEHGTIVEYCEKMFGA